MTLTVHDADHFSVTIPDGPRICVLTSDARPDPASCGVSAGQQTLPPPTDEQRTLAVGAVWISKSPATFSSAVVKLSVPRAENQESATAYAKGMTDSLVQRMPGAAPRPPRIDLQDIHGLTAARVTVDVDGLPADSRIVQHLVSYAVGAEEGLYSFTLTCGAADAAAADALAAEIAATMTLAHPAPARSSSYESGYAVGRVLGAVIPLVLALVVVVAVVLVVRRRSSRSNA
ncbi:MAG TPA: hypothetical protein VF765_35835 [Polyangiaceae bacterium]